MDIGGLFTFYDDGPVSLDPDDVSFVNQASGYSDTGALNFVPGADGVKTVNFMFTQGAPALDAQGNQISFNGDPLFLYYGDDGADKTHLVAKTAGGVIGYEIDIDPLSDSYTITTYGILSNGTEVSPTSLVGVGGGNVTWKALIDVGGTSQDVMMSTSSGNTINTNATQIGITDGNSFKAGEGIRFDFVNDLSAEKNGNVWSFNYTGGHNEISAFRQVIDWAQGLVNISITAILADGDDVFYGDTEGESVLDLSLVNINVYKTDGTLAIQGVDYQIVDGGNSVTLSGLSQGWTYEVLTGDNKFSAIQVDAAAGTANFKLGLFSYGESSLGEPVELSYDLIGVDGDGDSITGSLAVLVKSQDDPGLFVVGSNLADTPESFGSDSLLDDHRVPNLDEGQDGPVKGGAGKDLLIGDVGGGGSNFIPGEDYNVALVVDVSGSMAGTRLALLKESLVHLAEQLAQHDGKINVTLISFATGAEEKATIVDLDMSSLASLSLVINNLSAGGGTNYEAAFNATVGWFADSAKADPSYVNLTYFVTDGDPTYYYDDNNNLAGPGNSTNYSTLLNSVEAFAPLSDLSKVYGIGVGANVNETYLRFFDNTALAGSGTEWFGSTLATFSESSGLGSLTSWTMTGVGEMDRNDGYLRIEDDRGGSNSVARSGATVVTLNTNRAIAVAEGQGLSFEYRTANFNQGDKFNWQLVQLVGGVWVDVPSKSGEIIAATSTYLPISTGSLGAGSYGFVFSVFDGSGGNSNNDAEVRIDNIRLDLPVTGPVGQAQIVMNASELTAALVGGENLDVLLPAGSDFIHGGDGDDIIFGDVLNTDALAVARGLTTPPGSGWAVFELLEAGLDWTREDTLEYIRSHSSEMALETLLQGTGRLGGDDTIFGGAGNDLIFGQEGNDLVYGDAGNDILLGGSGNDTLYGGDGDDLLIGGPGDDVMSGGAGSDIFKYVAGDLAGVVDGDIISDFEFGQDQLDLSELLNGATVGNLGEYLRVADFVEIDATTARVILEVDADGASGDENYVRLATITMTGLDASFNENNILANMLDADALKIG